MTVVTVTYSCVEGFCFLVIPSLSLSLLNEIVK